MKNNKVSEFFSIALMAIALVYATKVFGADSSPFPSMFELSVASDSPARTAYVRGDYGRMLAKYEVKQVGDLPITITSFTIEASSTVSYAQIIANGNWYETTKTNLGGKDFYTINQRITVEKGKTLKFEIVGGIAYDNGFEDAWVKWSTISYDSAMAKVSEILPARHAVVDRQLGEGLGNSSLRATMSPGQPAIAGFAVKGDQSHSYQYLIRVVGPTLGKMGVVNALPDPELKVYDASNNLVYNSLNDDWEVNQINMSEIFLKVGAFPLPKGSFDAASVVNLSPGNYTIEIKANGASTQTGAVLIEIYPMENYYGGKG